MTKRTTARGRGHAVGSVGRQRRRSSGSRANHPPPLPAAPLVRHLVPLSPPLSSVMVAAAPQTGAAPRSPLSPSCSAMAAAAPRDEEVRRRAPSPSPFESGPRLPITEDAGLWRRWPPLSRPSTSPDGRSLQPAVAAMTQASLVTVATRLAAVGKPPWSSRSSPRLLAAEAVSRERQPPGPAAGGLDSLSPQGLLPRPREWLLLQAEARRCGAAAERRRREGAATLRRQAPRGRHRSRPLAASVLAEAAARPWQSS